LSAVSFEERKFVESKMPAVGQRYRDLSALFRNSDWVIERIFKGTDGFEHVVLRSAFDHMRQKTLTRSVVIDTNRFVLVAADNGGAPLF
jgi:hypothetical protein